MKQHWMVMWTLCWTDGRRDKDVKEFETFKSAKEFARKKICEIDVSDMIADMRRGINKKYRKAIADFLNNYYTDPDFPRSESDIPSSDPDDYKLLVADEDLEITLDPNYMQSECTGLTPSVKTDMVLFTKKAGDSEIPIDDWEEWPGICLREPYYVFDYLLDWKDEYLTGKPRIKSAYIKLYMTVRMEPLDIAMILKEGKKPMSSDEIAETFFSEQTYDGFDGPIIDARTLSHQIETLIGIGAIRELASGSYEMVTPDDGSPYYINPQSKLSTSAYPLAILNVLALSDKPLNLQEIADEINKKYGSSIKRQTVSKHLARLREDNWLGIQKDKTGYFISHEKEKEGTPE